MPTDDLIEWAIKQRDDALHQIELFSRQGVKAQLVMPDGKVQDITAGVLIASKGKCGRVRAAHNGVEKLTSA